ncbi:hypothetical protein [Actinomadura sp. HBU206391]|uniref:hypothetical protein n=1 Tax=Actinomadura sp. HBU206391 TaxID=2731692 RepID=UPI0016508455|nr:hypothetical protein [Actinomadura sp. HBU206391]MBC6463032.1 hypothetical protein [Actinomadura sp. HBU206391]
MPDHFDRLVARGTGLPTGAAGGGDAASVPARPRLPLPFERPDLVVTEDLVEGAGPRPAGTPPSGPGLPPPSAAPDTTVTQPALVRLIRHETILRERSQELGRSAPALESAPPEEWRPAPAPETPVAPAQREPAVPQEPRRPDTVRPAGELRPSRARRPVPSTAASPARAMVMKPDQTGATPPARRAARPPERVVRISIGRLEVTAAAAPRSPARDRPPSRREPAVSLDRFLARRAGEDGRA